MQKRIYGLLGFPLAHSFSKAYFEEKFRKESIKNTTYENFVLPKIEEVELLLVKENLQGFNITTPYKKLIIPYLNALDSTTEKIGAVNCVKKTGNSWTGYNTDILGFENSLRPLLQAHHSKAVVLGTGGASRAVCFVLEQLGIKITKVSSQEKEECINYYDLDYDLINSNKLIINTTIVGAFPNTDNSPDIPYEYLSPSHLCYDLTYHPAESMFLKKSSAMGAETKNGLEMLILQAEESWRIWNLK